MLEKVFSPDDIKNLTPEQLNELCGEIRKFLIEKVSATGGHLSSNLGTVELTVALHSVFSVPTDQIVFDVGHQCYTHKILTGRKDGFDKLRAYGGISGFPNPAESEYDSFVAGHGNMSVSAAIGLARAKKLKGEDGKVIVIVGDGAFTGGMIYEGINNIDTLDNLIVILNDNKMSISKNVGAVARYFTKLRTSAGYHRVKKNMESALDKIPVLGSPVKKGILAGKSVVRRAIYKSTWFEEMGFQYIGPVDGHNIAEMQGVFTSLDNQDRPVFIHAVTVKGKGFAPAEENPGAFHGVSGFDYKKITDPDIAPSDSFSVEFGKNLKIIAQDNKTVCAITAAMKYGTGLQYFYKAFPERFFDVGMAEQHAVTYAAGLAKNGMLPVVCIYSTFLQRGYDQIIHDVCLQNLNVLFIVDRAGLVQGDGETHQGVFDAAYLSQQQELTVISICNYSELAYWLEVFTNGSITTPRALRFCRGRQSEILKEYPCSKCAFDTLYKHDNSRIAIVSYGDELGEAVKAHDGLYEENIVTDVYRLTQIHPISDELTESLKKYEVIMFAEEGIENGGIAQQLGCLLLKNGFKGKYLTANTPTRAIDHAEVSVLRKEYGLDAESIYNALKGILS